MDIFIKVLLIYIILYFIIFKISLFKIFIKEKQKGIKSLIPIYDIWMYFSFIRIPKWISLVPVLNIIAFIVSPHNLSREFGLKRVWWSISIILPIIFVPYIAFSNRKDLYMNIETKYLKNQKDIDDLEEKLKNEIDEGEIQTISKKDEIVDIKPDQETDQFDFQDELVEEEPEKMQDIIVDPAINDNVTKTINEDLAIDEVVNLSEYTNTSETIESLETDEVDTTKLDNTIENKNIDELDVQNVDAKERSVTKQIQDFKDIGPSTEAIAFGGKEKIENTIKAKVEDLKCPRCGASIIGARGVCPGCGMKLEEIET